LYSYIGLRHLRGEWPQDVGYRADTSGEAKPQHIVRLGCDPSGSGTDSIRCNERRLQTLGGRQ
jgi:hypothetical protein